MRWRFEVRLTLQTSCPSRFAWFEGEVGEGRGELGGEGLEEIERELGALDGLREVALGHELDVWIARAVVHPVDSSARDFAQALLAVARTVRGREPNVPYVRKLVIEPLERG